jgi:hypothetical protein
LGIIGKAPVYPQAVISGIFKEPVEALACKRSLHSLHTFEDPKPRGNCSDSWMVR